MSKNVRCALLWTEKNLNKTYFCSHLTLILLFRHYQRQAFSIRLINIITSIDELENYHSITIKPNPSQMASSISPNHLGQAAPATTSISDKQAIVDNSRDTDTYLQAPPIVYGEISILGYNGYIPNAEKSGRRNKSKYLLYKRATPNGIKKSRHYIVKQPQATKAIQDKDLHSISYTFSRSQTIIVEYRQDNNTDMFQIGRSTESPIDFVVMDTVPALAEQSSSTSSSSHRQLTKSSEKHSRNSSSGQQMITMDNPYYRNMVKDDHLQQYGFPHRMGQPQFVHRHGQSGHAVLLNYPQPNMSNLPPSMVDHFRNQGSALFQHNQQLHYHNNYNQQHLGHASGSSHPQPSMQHEQQSHHRSSNINNDNYPISDIDHLGHTSNSRHSNAATNASCKRSHATQSTISRFACRILVDRNPPYTARIYAAGFDSSRNIFLGEKATKWEKDNTIDGLTTNGVLLMHPKRGNFYDDNPQNITDENNISVSKPNPSSSHNKDADSNNNNNNDDTSMNLDNSLISKEGSFESGGVWREVSVDGGIYAIRESRSAVQKGKRIEHETNILQDGTLIDLCGATLLWRSVDGFKASPTKKTLEEKIDLLNASRPQCPVGLNTLIIPRKPILPSTQHHRNAYHASKSSRAKESSEKNSHQPYVYLKCGHVQGYHDWGTTDKANQRTCPICFSSGTVAKLSMGLEPSFYVDSGPLTHVFNPCGHMASERTIRYWSSTKIPHGTHFFHAICPFCATPLATDEPAFIKLIFQDDLD